MRPVFFIIGILVLNLVCSSKSGCGDSEKGVQLNIHWQFASLENGDIQDIIDTLVVIKRGNYFVCLSRILKENILMNINKEGDLLSQKTLSVYPIWGARIFKEGDPVGMKYDSLQAEAGKFFHVDSFRTGNMCKGMEIYSNGDSLLLVEFTSKKNNIELMEKYVPKYVVENAFDSLYCYYTSENIETDISFSHKLEHARQLRLSKVVVIYNAIPAGKYSFAIPKRKMEWEIKNTTVPYKQEIDALLKRYKAVSF